MSGATDRRRRARFRDQGLHGVISARVRPGHAVDIVDVSAAGALVETEKRLLPGAPIELQLTTEAGTTPMRGRVVRCSVARLRPSSVLYRGGISFDTHLPWFADRDDVMSGGAFGNEVRVQRANRAAGSPALVG